MNLSALVIEQLEHDGHLRTFKLLPEPGRQLTVAFADEYEESRSGPFHFLNEQDEKVFEKGFAECRARKLPESRFAVVEGGCNFQHSWAGLPTRRNCLSYYALSLPEFAVPIKICFEDPHSGRPYSKNVIRDDRRNRFVAYLGCRSSHGSFDFLLHVRFTNDRDNFRRSKYTDDHMARHGVQLPSYEHLLMADHRHLVEQFFSQNVGHCPPVSSVLPFLLPPTQANTMSGPAEYARHEKPAKAENGKLECPDKVPAKKRDFSNYFDGANLTENQREVISLKWEHEMSELAIARHLGKNRTTIHEHLMAAQKKLEQVRSAEKRAAKRSTHPE